MQAYFFHINMTKKPVKHTVGEEKACKTILYPV